MATDGVIDTNTVVPEESGATGFAFSFETSTGGALTPDVGSVNVKIIKADGTEIRDIGVVSSSTEITVVPTAADNTLTKGESPQRGILVEWTETTGRGSNLPNKAVAWYKVRDLQGV